MSLDASNKVGEFYNQNTDKFLEVYGEINQAFRTNDASIYLDYTIKNAELTDRQKILDAGCGVGGSASYFASRLNVEIEGVTVSEVQVIKSKEVIVSKKLKGKINICRDVTHADGTCRVQTSNEQQNKKYFELLQSFKQKTGTGALLNTSFNLNHEPIVYSPCDAVTSFYASGLDILFIGNFMITK